MNEWIALLSNFGVGGGLAFLFAWYLMKSLVPSLTKNNEDQREAFLKALRDERSDFLMALRELRETQEKVGQKLTDNLVTLASEVRDISRVLGSALSRQEKQIS